jgi:hypothetical protein
MDMRYHWLTDRVRQKQVDVYLRPGRENLADYHTKHHSAQHHKDMRHLILHEAKIVFRFCEGVLNYSHSRNPPCAPARTHGQIQAPREPPN